MGNNMNILKVTALVGASMMVAPTAMAASILIDSFTTRQQVSANNISTGGTPLPAELSPDSITGDPSIRGGARTLAVTNTPGVAQGSVLVSTGDPLPAFDTLNDPGILRFAISAGVGTATVTYDGDIGGDPLVGLGDLTDGGTNDRFLFSDITGDLTGTTFLTTMMTNAGQTFSFLEALAPGVGSTTKFSSLSQGVDGGDGINFATLADFSSVGSLSFTFFGPTTIPTTFDGSISGISVVPLPASILFLLGGLGGLAGVSAGSKRRRKA